MGKTDAGLIILAVKVIVIQHRTTQQYMKLLCTSRERECGCFTRYCKEHFPLRLHFTAEFNADSSPLFFHHP